MTYFLLLYVASLAHAYEIRFTEATLALGLALSETKTGRGYQDAITPPISTTLAIVMYIFVVLVVSFGFYKYGLWIGLGSLLGYFLLVFINGLILFPKADSEHFRKLIIGSMVNRYANYRKAGDNLRAGAMENLLESAGVPVKELVKEFTDRQ